MTVVKFAISKVKDLQDYRLLPDWLKNIIVKKFIDDPILKNELTQFVMLDDHPTFFKASISYYCWNDYTYTYIIFEFNKFFKEFKYIKYFNNFKDLKKFIKNVWNL